MRPPGRAAALIELLDKVRAEWHPTGIPADRVIASYFRERRFIGGGDRRWISDTLYGILRNWRTLVVQVEKAGLSSSSRAILIQWLATLPDDISQYFAADQRYGPGVLTDTEMAALSALKNPEAPTSPAVKANMPDEFYALLVDRFGATAPKDSMAMNEMAPLDIRINRLSKQAGPPSDAGEWEPLARAPHGYRAFGFPRLTGHKDYLDGGFEIQDEASQICAELVAATPGMTVVDYCAGAGGKSLALAAALQNKGRLIAMDVNKRRLSGLKARAERAGVNCIEQILLSGRAAERLNATESLVDKADRVLVDAPCSGSGTWRRNPAQRWHYGVKDIEKFHSQQVEILSEAARLVRPGGHLIYATCSLFEKENEQSVFQMLNLRKDFELIDFKTLWGITNLKSTAAETLATDPRFLQLAPSRHDTDGFFVAILARS